MPKIFVISRDGREHQIDATEGYSLMEVLRARDDFDIVAACGGCASCATCHIYVLEDLNESLSPVGDDEESLLSIVNDRREGSRLSCQVMVTPDIEGLRLEIAPEE